MFGFSSVDHEAMGIGELELHSDLGLTHDRAWQVGRLQPGFRSLSVQTLWWKRLWRTPANFSFIVYSAKVEV